MWFVVKNITRCLSTGEGQWKGKSGGIQPPQVWRTHISLAITARPFIAAQAEVSGSLCRSTQDHSVQGLDGGQIRALFDNCLKLASENKITAKNTWDLPLIDHLSDLVQVLALHPEHAPGAMSPAGLQRTCTSPSRWT